MVEFHLNSKYIGKHVQMRQFPPNCFTSLVVSVLVVGSTDSVPVLSMDSDLDQPGAFVQLATLRFVIASAGIEVSTKTG